MAADKLISVVVPVLNGEKYIQRCLTSLLNQTYPNIEIVIIDNGSTDDSVNIIENNKDNRIRLLHENRKGVSYARNTGLKNVKGEFVAFVDCDDWVEEDYFYVLVANIGNRDIIGCDFYTEYESEKITRRYFLGEKKDFCIKAANDKVRLLEEGTMYSSVVWAKLYRRNSIWEQEFRIQAYGEDSEFASRVLLNCQEVKYISYKGYHYFLNEDSATVKKKGRELEEKYGAMSMLYSINVELFGKKLKSKILEERLLHVTLNYIKSALKRGSLGDKKSRRMLSEIKQCVNTGKLPYSRKLSLSIWPFTLISRLENRK